MPMRALGHRQQQLKAAGAIAAAAVVVALVALRRRRKGPRPAQPGGGRQAPPEKAPEGRTPGEVRPKAGGSEKSGVGARPGARSMDARAAEAQERLSRDASPGPVESAFGTEIFDEKYLDAHGLGGGRGGRVRRLGEGDSMLILDVLPGEDAGRAFGGVLDECAWSTMQHKGGEVPRRIAIQGTVADGVEPVYRHPADEQPDLRRWTPVVERCKGAVEAATSQSFNHALIQHYRGGRDFIGEHSDKTLDVLRGSAIVNFSLGAARTIILRQKKFGGARPADGKGGAPGRRTQRIVLPHNSVFVLGWETNLRWTHAIKQDRRADGLKTSAERAFGAQRVSLTLRSIATFRDTGTGRLFGQGAPEAPEAPAEGRGAEDEAVALLTAFSAENRRADFSWEEHYGRGFRCLNFRILSAP